MNNPNRQELPMPSLENLPLKDFKDLLIELQALDRAADILEDAGLDPLLHLVPGEIMSLSIATAMPEACDAHAELFGSKDSERVFIHEVLLKMGGHWSPADDKQLLREIAARPDVAFSTYAGDLAADLGLDAAATWSRMHFLTDPRFAPYRKADAVRGPETGRPVALDGPWNSPPPEQTPADAPPVANEGATGGAAEGEAFTFAPGADPDHPIVKVGLTGGLNPFQFGTSELQFLTPPAPEDSPPAAGGGGADDLLPDSAAEPISETEIQTEAREKPLPNGQSPAEEGGGGAGSVPATVSDPADKAGASWNNPWTEEDHDDLVEGMALAIVLGKSFTAAAHSMAHDLGRSGQACWMRAHQRLRPRIEARVDELRARNVAPAEADPIPAGQPAPAAAPAATAGEGPGKERVETQDPPAGAAVAGATPIRPAAAPSTPKGPIDRHVDDLPRLTHGRRWTLAEDADLLRCVVNGMKLPEISADLQLDAGKIKARIAALTERFSAEKMLAALEARLPQAAE
jgi:hypothetical protein